MKELIKKLLKIKFIKVSLCVTENFIKFIYLPAWKWIEKRLYNPYDFGDNNIENYKKQYEYFIDFCNKNSIDLNWKSVLELWPGWFLWFWAFIKKHWVSKYFAIDDINHFEHFTQKHIDLYKKIDETVLKENMFDLDYINVLKYNNNWIQLQDQSVDMVFSNAVFEHINNPQESIKELSRITKSWWYSIHTIDFRDHIFEQKSLFFLTIPKRLFNFLFARAGAWTNRLRYQDFKNMFEKNWFELIEENVLIEYGDQEIEKYSSLKKKYWKDNLKIASVMLFYKKK